MLHHHHQKWIQKYPTDEFEKLNPEYPYALIQKIGEDIVMSWGKIYNLNVTSLRFLIFMVKDKNIWILWSNV